MRGRVVTRARNGVFVAPGKNSELHFCRVPSKGKSTRVNMPVPGDWIVYDPPSDVTDGWVRGIEPRISLFRRYVFARIKDIAANMEQVLLLICPESPVVSPRLVDRMLAGASAGKLEPVIVLNKSDLFSRKRIEEYLQPWRDAGYPVLVISALKGNGLEQLENVLSGRDSLLFGASGVGKSTLLNRLIDDLDLDTSSISRATGRGVHTTTFTYLYSLPDGGIVADTPGIREFYPVVEADELRFHFPEFEPLSEECAWRDCLHLDEEGCAVRAAAEDGRIHPARYQSYRILYRSLLEGPDRGRRHTDHEQT